MQQIGSEGGDPRSNWHGRVAALGKGATRSCAASGASADMRAMLRDDERTRRGQVVHLTRRVIERRARRQRAAARRAVRRKMIDDHVGRGRLPENLPLVPFPTARLPSGVLARAPHPPRPLHSLPARRPAALRVVQAETALQFRDPRHKRGDLCRLRMNQRDQFCTGRSIWRFSHHPILESESDSRVQENQLKNHGGGKQPG